MKIITYILLINLVTNTSFGQKLSTHKQYITAVDTFLISQVPPIITMNGDTLHHIVIYNIKNKYKNGISFDVHAIPVFSGQEYVDKESIKLITYGVLQKKIKNLHQNGETISFIFKFEPSGKIVDIVFGLDQNTIISLEDIREIDRLIRLKITATFTGLAYKTNKVIDYVGPYIKF